MINFFVTLSVWWYVAYAVLSLGIGIFVTKEVVLPNSKGEAFGTLLIWSVLWIPLVLWFCCDLLLDWLAGRL